MLRRFKIWITIYIIAQIAIASFSVNSLAYYLSSFNFPVSEYLQQHRQNSQDTSILLFNELSESETETDESFTEYFKHLAYAFNSFHQSIFGITDAALATNILRLSQIQYNPSYLHIATFLYVADLRI